MFGLQRTYRGKIKRLDCIASSLLWDLVISRPAGNGTEAEIEDRASIESRFGVRQLAACFGATEGSGDLQEKIEGQEIVYSVDSFGVLIGFTPLDEWEGPDIPPEGITEEDVEDGEEVMGV